MHPLTVTDSHYISHHILWQSINDFWNNKEISVLHNLPLYFRWVIFNILYLGSVMSYENRSWTIRTIVLSLCHILLKSLTRWLVPSQYSPQIFKRGRGRLRVKLMGQSQEKGLRGSTSSPEMFNNWYSKLCRLRRFLDVFEISVAYCQILFHVRLTFRVLYQFIICQSYSLWLWQYFNPKQRVFFLFFLPNIKMDDIKRLATWHQVRHCYRRVCRTSILSYIPLDIIAKLQT